MNKGRVRLRLWPQPYAVARLAGLPVLPGDAAADDPPVCVVVGHGEVSLLAPETFVASCGAGVEASSEGWRAITLDAVFPLGVVGVLATVSEALAQVAIPVMTFSSHATDHLLVPGEQLGRALAVLNQTSLDKLFPD